MNTGLTYFGQKQVHEFPKLSNKFYPVSTNYPHPFPLTQGEVDYQAASLLCVRRDQGRQSLKNRFGYFNGFTTDVLI